MKTNDLLLLGAAAAGGYFVLRAMGVFKLDATSGTVTLEVGKQYRITGNISLQRGGAAVGTITSFGYSPTQPTTITIGRSQLDSSGATFQGVVVTVTRVEEI